MAPKTLPVNSPPTINAVRRWHRALEQAESTRFAWRKTSARMGLYACPEPRDFAGLFQAAAAEWNAIRDPIERALLCGLAVLLIHPLVDGNGRLSRLIWREQLFAAGVGRQQIDAALEQVFTHQRAQWIGAVAEARRGNPAMVYAQLRKSLCIGAPR